MCCVVLHPAAAQPAQTSVGEQVGQSAERPWKGPSGEPGKTTGWAWWPPSRGLVGLFPAPRDPPPTGNAIGASARFVFGADSWCSRKQPAQPLFMHFGHFRDSWLGHRRRDRFRAFSPRAHADAQTATRPDAAGPIGSADLTWERSTECSLCSSWGCFTSPRWRPYASLKSTQAIVVWVPPSARVLPRRQRTRLVRDQSRLVVVASRSLSWRIAAEPHRLDRLRRSAVDRRSSPRPDPPVTLFYLPPRKSGGGVSLLVECSSPCPNPLTPTKP